MAKIIIMINTINYCHSYCLTERILYILFIASRLYFAFLYLRQSHHIRY